MKSIFAILLALLCGAVHVDAHAKGIKTFEKCYKDRTGSIPTPSEREFLDAYLAYLKSGTEASGKKAITKMEDLAKTQGGQFSIEWASVFEGARALCCGGPEACTESFGSASSTKLRPRVEKGEATALKFVLMYQKLAKSDGADAAGLNEYLDVIEKKYPKAIAKFKKANP